MENKELINVITNEYELNIDHIEKSSESTAQNVYIINTKENKYVLKIYDNLKHVTSMCLLHNNLSSKLNVPKIIKTKNNSDYVLNNSKYLVLYSFLEGSQLYKLDNLSNNIIKEIALNLRKLHSEVDNSCNLEEVEFCKNYNIERKSLLHFDLTKGNIFYKDGSIGFIDFDDAKYGPSVCDVAIFLLHNFIRKKTGINNEGINIFLNAYYGNDLDLRNNEIKHIKEIAINWINLVLKENEFNPSTKESFEIKIKLIKEQLCIPYLKLIPINECINEELYEMYQDIPLKEIGSANKYKDISYEVFLENIKEENDTKRYILFNNNIPIGEVGIRTTINDFWVNKGSQIYYKIRYSERGKGYGSIILYLALKEAKKIGFKKIRINCDNNNIPSKKIILKNEGKRDIIDYKTEDGYSTSYLINIK